ncbi:hypothetical protein [Roseivirga thermotolerans]|uniref:Uncharacterized protein n=1 Tax=Roseivirga thermotolerans TaxID=1758176 RepID=A0ABQ3I527_9BACT|nr:hypothetical protein [Roseivirga thermotolerans]GHE65131.1 hypothetical protein GCM10011340_20230 [Roseivirga thermotolerans]
MSDKFTTEILAEVKMIQQMIIIGHYTPGPSLRANEVERGNLPDETPQVEEQPAKTPANLYLHLAIFWLTGSLPLELIEWLGALRTERQRLTQQQWQRIALAFIALEIDQRKHEPGMGILLIQAERKRQIVRGYTTARDLSLYRFRDDLLRFAIYRLTDNKQFYPWQHNLMINEKQGHDLTERIIQSGAILLAHDTMKLAAGQHSTTACHSREGGILQEQTEGSTEKEVSC